MTRYEDQPPRPGCGCNGVGPEREGLPPLLAGASKTGQSIVGLLPSVPCAPPQL